MENQYKLYGLGVLLPIYPLLFYVANNAQSFALPEIAITLGLLIIASILSLGLLQLIFIKFNFSKTLYIKICTGLLLLFWLVMMKQAIFENPDLYNTAKLLTGSNYLKWIIYGTSAFLIFALGFFLISQNLAFFLILLSILNLWNITQAIYPAFDTTNKEIVDFKEETVEMKKRKNIFFILTDSLTNINGMEMLGLKIDMQPFLTWMETKGFTHYPNFYTSLQPTMNALYTYMNMSYKKDGTIAYLNGRNRRNDIINDGKLYQILRKNGYAINIFHEMDYLWDGKCAADVCYFANQHLKKPLKVRVVATIALLLPSSFRHYLTPADTNLFADPALQASHNQKEFIDSTIRFLKKMDLSQPTFTYIHAFTLPTHSATDIATVNNCNEKIEIDLYKERVKRTTKFLSSTIQTIKTRDKDAMIIIAGDHGPYIFRHCTRDGIYRKNEIMERQGAFLAVKWGVDYDKKYDGNIKSSHNLFRYILSFLANNEQLLIDKEKDNAFTYYPGSNVYSGSKVALTVRDGLPANKFKAVT
ncbi:sulfatase-like hydrolase/transferase [Legionella jamestowniensis]|uniref:Sulfatase n=1 Tax=Legionella jamestowniensis TaxID=455 RepID=A0A0W0UGR9_9GAMM|nr:sulfatase-like hydrolase/transferase [Legionella jamestowniensis]KTD06822.1 Sulfatase [Legionella jamestowniensis]SFL82682.1 Sulfatase [Legionella jamestowniensis DSM 19215]